MWYSVKLDCSYKQRYSMCRWLASKGKYTAAEQALHS